MSASTEPEPQIIGRRVEAWYGHRAGQHGEVVRVHGWGWWIIRWDDGSEDRYWSSDIVREDTEQYRMSR